MASRGPGRPRSAEAHAAILGAAIDLVREVGYDAVTMDGIAARAGVGKATVYRRWTSKEALVVEALGRLVAAMPVPDTGDTHQDVLLLMLTHLRMYQDPATGALLSGLVAAMARSEAIAHAVRSGFIAIRERALRGVLERGAARGDLPPDVDPVLATELLNGPLFYRYLIHGGPMDEEMVHGVVRAVLRGLAPGA
ncbi:MAG TPA: TetR/AcrR family transcriptional regulator [Longimicrobium sp.]|nr:TetR/AcrR family transcriptional regulator [Longimicrobium sp.]